MICVLNIFYKLCLTTKNIFFSKRSIRLICSNFPEGYCIIYIYIVVPTKSGGWHFSHDYIFLFLNMVKLFIICISKLPAYYLAIKYRYILTYN